MSRFPTRQVARSIDFRAPQLAGAFGESEIRDIPTAFEEAAGTLRLKSALKRAFAKTEAPAYLIDAIRREIRK